jgi:hypothetical protein
MVGCELPDNVQASYSSFADTLGAMRPGGVDAALTRHR